MRFIFRIDVYFSQVVNAILHPNDSNGSTNCAQYLRHKIYKAVFLSPTNDIHFSERQLFFSGRECHSPFEGFERIDNCEQYLSHKICKALDFSAPLMIFISRNDNSFSRVVNDVLHSYDLNGSTTLTPWT